MKRLIRFLIVCATVVGIYMTPMFFSEMSWSYLAESAVKSGFIVAMCDYCRKDHKELAFIIAIEFLMCTLCAIIALRWHPGMISAEVLITDISNLAYGIEIIILLSIGVHLARRADFSITYNRRRDDLYRDNRLESLA